MAKSHCTSTPHKFDCSRNILDVDGDLLPSCWTEGTRICRKQDIRGTGRCTDDCLKAGQERNGKSKGRKVSQRSKYRVSDARMVQAVGL